MLNRFIVDNLHFCHSRLPEETELLVEARQRNCKVVEPADIYVDQISAQFKAIAGKELPSEVFREALAFD